MPPTKRSGKNQRSERNQLREKADWQQSAFLFWFEIGGNVIAARARSFPATGNPCSRTTRETTAHRLVAMREQPGRWKRR
jgi:hypothetical protein